MAAAMFMNSNSLPIALMQSLVATVPDLKWDEDDDKNTMLGRALTYLVMYSTLGMMVSLSTSRKSRELTNGALSYDGATEYAYFQKQTQRRQKQK